MTPGRWHHALGVPFGVAREVEGTCTGWRRSATGRSVLRDLSLGRPKLLQEDAELLDLLVTEPAGARRAEELGLRRPPARLDRF